MPASTPLKKPQQLLLPLRKTPSKKTHGGRRRGAGRPNLSGLQAHVRRPRLNRREPIHVTLKLSEGLPSLRRKDVFQCLRHAVKRARTQGLAIAHFAILSNHVHLIVEPGGASLGREFQSLCISFSKRLNGLLGRSGAVFRERYHLHVLRTPSETRHALAYVLSNESRHRSRRMARRMARKTAQAARAVRPGLHPKDTQVEIKIDPFSSALAFMPAQWKTLFKKAPRFEFTNWNEDWIQAWHEEALRPPKTWLLTRGWRFGR